MKFIQGKPRNQWEMYCLDEHVDADNEVRLIDPPPQKIRNPTPHRDS
jgi:hypothetical protein